MKKIMLFLFLVASLTYSAGFYCNDGVTDVYAIGKTACHAYTENFTFGLIQSIDGSPSYYFVDFNDVLFTIGSEQNVAVRLIVYSNESDFNSIQAITQTAYATNSMLHIIFRNPELQQNLNTYGANGRKLCQRYAGVGSSMVCHVDAISIVR